LAIRRAAWWAGTRPQFDPAMAESFWQRGGGWVTGQFALMAAVAGLTVAFPGRPPVGILVLAGLLALAGGGLGVAGAVALRQGLTPFPKPGRTGLVQTGIYAHMRHPLYTSVMLLATAWALGWGSGPGLAAALALIPFFAAKARREERWLREAFPGYADYARRVPRFWPRLCCRCRARGGPG